jgi:hypothetical protein
MIAAALCLAWAPGSAFQGPSATFTLYTPDARRTIVVRTNTTPETIALEQLAGTFGLTFTEDRTANGLVIGTRGERIYAFPGQAFVRAAGRVIALDGPLQRERNAWVAPLDFLAKALGPAIGQPIVVRRASKLVLVGNVRVPEVALVSNNCRGARVDRVPAADASARDARRQSAHRALRRGRAGSAPMSGFMPDFAPAARVDGSNLVIDLGRRRSSIARTSSAFRTLTIDLLPAPPPPPSGASRPRSLPSSTFCRRRACTRSSSMPDTVATTRRVGAQARKGGHGAADGPAPEAAIEARLGLRVLMTREGDEMVPDRRTELASNNKADLFLSLTPTGPSAGGAGRAGVHPGWTPRAHALPPPTCAGSRCR